MIQLTVSQSQVTGTIDETSLANGASSTQSHHAGFTGTLDGQSLTISIPEGLGFSASASGTLTSESLALSVPSSDGTISTVTLLPSSTEGYNQQVTALQGQASSNLTQEQQASAQAAQASANAEAANTAQTDLSNLQSLNSGFTNARAVRNDVSKADSDLTQERQDAANGNGDNCYNVQVTVSYDATTNVGYDVNTDASYDIQQEQSAIDSTQKLISALQQDEATLQSDGLQATPGAADAIKTAQSQSAEAVTTTNNAIDQLNADLAEAYRIANAAGTGDCAGDGPGATPSGLSHIS